MVRQENSHAAPLNDKLTASGTFTVKKAEGSSGTLFGWFHEDSRGWRTPGFARYVAINRNGNTFWVFFEYGTKHLRTGGGHTFEGDRYQTTKTKPFPADGRPHRWNLTYDPEGHDGDGLITFTLNDQTVKTPLVPGHKADGASFNRFGIFNQQISGKGMELYFDDLILDGDLQAFDQNPHWEGRGDDHRLRRSRQTPLA